MTGGMAEFIVFCRLTGRTCCCDDVVVTDGGTFGYEIEPVLAGIGGGARVIDTDCALFDVSAS